MIDAGLLSEKELITLEDAPSRIHRVVQARLTRNS